MQSKSIRYEFITTCIYFGLIRKDRMVSWFMQSDALGVVKLLFWGSALTSLLCFLLDRHLHLLLKAHWKADPFVYRSGPALASSNGRGILPRDGIRRLLCVHGCWSPDSGTLSDRNERSHASVFDRCMRRGQPDFVQAIRELSRTFDRISVCPLCVHPTSFGYNRPSAR
jgi:hypothetical protein